MNSEAHAPERFGVRPTVVMVITLLAFALGTLFGMLLGGSLEKSRPPVPIPPCDAAEAEASS